MIRIILFVVFIFYSGDTISQTTNSSNWNGMDKTFTFYEEDFSQAIILKINNTYNQIKFKFKGELIKGTFVINIIDPNGKREGGFELQTLDLDTKNKSLDNNAAGSMDKKIINPINGNWVIKIIAYKAIGHVDISIKK